MRATILPMADILTKAHRAAVSFLFLLPTYIHICANIMQYTHIHDTDNISLSSVPVGRKCLHWGSRPKKPNVKRIHFEAHNTIVMTGKKYL